MTDCPWERAKRKLASLSLHHSHGRRIDKKYRQMEKLGASLHDSPFLLLKTVRTCTLDECEHRQTHFQQVPGHVRALVQAQPWMATLQRSARRCVGYVRTIYTINNISTTHFFLRTDLMFLHLILDTRRQDGICRLSLDAPNRRDFRERESGLS